MKLFIVESPNKCGKLKSFLGADYKVMASVGHIREIPKKGMNIDIKGGFIPTFQVSSGKKDVVKNIKSAAKNAEEIIPVVLNLIKSRRFIYIPPFLFFFLELNKLTNSFNY